MYAEENGAGAGGATLTAGPTSRGMVRILVEDGGQEIPMDLEPDQAEKISDELRAAAERARTGTSCPGGRRVAPARRGQSDGPGRRQ